MILILATKNKDKIREITSELTDFDLEIKSAFDYPGVPEVEEDADSFEGNALKKARAVAEATGELVLADDSGLEVDALDGRPGVHSARYAGEHGDYLANNRKLLEELQGVPSQDRQARFRCVIAVGPLSGEFCTVEGTVEGSILEEARGENGFGYDPVFFYPERGVTFAEMSTADKNAVSHRGAAVREARELLKKHLSARQG